MLDASFQTPLLAQPTEGSKTIAYTLDFTAKSSVSIDLTADILMGQMAFIQSVYIDNADNSVPVDLTFLGGPTPNYRVRAQANSQGWYPVCWPVGATRLVGASNSGAKISVQFSNIAMPYLAWGPASGVLVTPPLVNNALAPLNFAGAGSQPLVAAVAGQTVKLYRGIFNVDQPAVLLFQDGNGGPTLFSATLTAGGSLTFQATGVPWFNTSLNNGLYLNSNAAVNVYGGFGYVQS